MTTYCVVSKRGRIRSGERFTTRKAAEILGISDSQFRTLAQDVEPCGWYVNPYYKSGPMCPFWLGKDLQRLKKRAMYRRMVAKRTPVEIANRKAAAKKGFETKARKLENYIDSLEINLPYLTEEELYQEACDNFNSNSRNLQRATPENSSGEFLSRISVNYLRHCCTRYEDELERLSGKAGKDYAYLKLRERVHSAIESQYPSLIDASRAQIARVWQTNVLSI
jgi:hypothetical protein